LRAGSDDLSIAHSIARIERDEMLTMPGGPSSYYVMAKPTGPICNLDCEYCFFLSKEMLYP
jgi:sulfatase maturation enzyme AslB (radical SAM superfamily)